MDSVCWCCSDLKCPHNIAPKVSILWEEIEKSIDDILVQFDRKSIKNFLKRDTDGNTKPAKIKDAYEASSSLIKGTRERPHTASAHLPSGSYFDCCWKFLQHTWNRYLFVVFWKFNVKQSNNRLPMLLVLMLGWLDIPNLVMAGCSLSKLKSHRTHLSSWPCRHLKFLSTIRLLHLTSVASNWCPSKVTIN